MNKFVCVRLVQANRLNLTKFQFDFDLTFAVFFMNPDGTIYGRYGTRSSRTEAETELSSKGLAAAMQGALALHMQYPKNKAQLAGKQPKATKYKTPNDYPMLKGKYKATINYKNNTARSCLHCHQIHGAQQAVYRNAGKPIPDKLIFFYPMPEVIGVTIDPKTRAMVSEVTPNSAAAKAGFKAGDEIISLDGQGILSIADMQWVLHHAGETGELTAHVARKGGSTAKLTITLAKGWRSATDIAWRAGSWPLRRMGSGGLVLKALSEVERKRAKLRNSELGLRVDGMGQFGPFAAARNAGFRKNDIVVSFNGLTKALSPSGFLALTVQTTKPGQRVPVVVLRQGKRIKLTLPMQR